MSAQRITTPVVLLLATALSGQSAPPAPTSVTQSAAPTIVSSGAPADDKPAPAAGHDISMVDAVTPGSVISVPLPGKQQKRLKKYEIPELVGARQALGSQLVNGELPRPLVDYRSKAASVEQQLSIFSGGLVVVRMSGASGTMRKRVIIPADALAAYLKKLNAESIAALGSRDVIAPGEQRRALLRVYRDDGSHAEIAFDPSSVVPKPLDDAVRPIADLFRAISEDREVTSSVAGYEPKVGDELVGDDNKLWRVERVIADSGIVQLHGVNEPTVIYVEKQYLYNYFIGKPAK